MVEPICRALQVRPVGVPDSYHAARQFEPALLPARAQRDAQLLLQGAWETASRALPTFGAHWLVEAAGAGVNLGAGPSFAWSFSRSDAQAARGDPVESVGLMRQLIRRRSSSI